MSNAQIQALQDNIDNDKEVVKVGEALRRLESNKDFKTLIKTGYLEKEAIRLVHLKADPSMQNPSSQDYIDKQIAAIGFFSVYLNYVTQSAGISKKNIETAEEMIEAIEQEGV